MSAQRNVERAVEEALVSGGSVAGEHIRPNRILRLAARNARVDDVDYAADRGGAEEQSGRTAQHLDALRGHWIDGDGVVGARRGKVEAANAVGQHANSVACQAAKNRR